VVPPEVGAVVVPPEVGAVVVPPEVGAVVVPPEVGAVVVPPEVGAVVVPPEVGAVVVLSAESKNADSLCALIILQVIIKTKPNVITMRMHSILTRLELILKLVISILYIYIFSNLNLVC